MKTLKLLILANDCNWSSWPEKIADLEKWFEQTKKVDVQISLLRSSYYNIPFSDYSTVPDQYNKSLLSTNLKGINPQWYDENVSKRAIGYDMVLFVCNQEEWKAPGIRGWRADSNFGPIEMQVIGVENEMAMNGTMTVNSFLSATKHELSHALYQLAGCPDRTHEFYYGGDLNLDKTWGDIVFKAPAPVDTQSKFTLRAKVAWVLFKLFKPTITESDVKIGIFCSAIQRHEGWYPGSKSFRNNSPGNLRYIGQVGSIGQDKTGFAIFKTYEDGWRALTEMIKRAASGKSSLYKPTMTMFQFFSVYAPQIENDTNRYAQFMQEELGTDDKFTIGDLMK